MELFDLIAYFANEGQLVIARHDTGGGARWEVIFTLRDTGAAFNGHASKLHDALRGLREAVEKSIAPHPLQRVLESMQGVEVAGNDEGQLMASDPSADVYRFLYEIGIAAANDDEEGRIAEAIEDFVVDQKECPVIFRWPRIRFVS
jgi:hypothetical protein